MGSFLFMGLIGIVIAMLVNIFLKSSGARLGDLGDRRAASSSGLTAYDTQRIKEMY